MIEALKLTGMIVAVLVLVPVILLLIGVMVGAVIAIAAVTFHLVT